MLHKIICILTAMFLAASLPLSASDILASDSCFAHIDSNTYVVADQMPRYIEEVFVGKVSPEGYDIELCYPELKSLSTKEIKLVRALQKSGVVAFDSSLDTEGVILAPSPAPIGGLNLTTTMKFDRKQGYLNISFCPIVRHEGEWKRILSCQIKINKRQQRSLSKATSTESERWSANSVLASGKWAKVSVKNEGIYQLTASDIQKMGFSDLNRIHIYGYGGLIQNETFDFRQVEENALNSCAPDDLDEVPVYITEDGRLLFWAEGTTRLDWNNDSFQYTHIKNVYSNYSAYFVTENSQPTLKVEKLSDEEATTSIVTDVPHVVFYDNDVTSWYPGGRRMFDAHDFSVNSSQSCRLATPGFNVNGLGTQKIEISVGASSSLGATTVNAKVNSTSLGNITVEKIFSDNEIAKTYTTQFSTLSALSPSENNTFVLTPTSANKARLDFIRINYPRHLALEGTPYSFSPQKDVPVTLRIAGCNATTHIWRLGQKGSPTAEIPAKLNTNGQLDGTVSAGRRRYVFFDASQKYESPTYMGSIENQNLHADRNIDYIIVVPTNGKLVEQATRLGEIHKKHDGLTYKVVRADQLYNEFSSGTPDANAYRRYLKMLYDRAGDDENAMPRYCLFMGKSSWDNRLITEENKGASAEDYLLAYEADNPQYDKNTGSVGSVNSYVTDDFFGLLDDGEGYNIPNERLDIALGRMICGTEADAKLLVDKVESYINNTDSGSWKNTVAFLADCGNSNRHMQDSESVVGIVEEVAPNLDIQKVYWDRYTWTSAPTGYTFPQATARIKQLMTEGVLLFNYSGHGSPNMISHYKLLQTPDFAESYSPHMSLWVLASCEIYPFDSGENNLAETSLYLPVGGSIAFICATRAVFADRNNFFNMAYSRQVLSRDENGRQYSIGEALRRAKTTIIDNNKDTTINKLKYICFGDPALRLSQPTGTVVLDSINGISVASQATLMTLPAGSAARFSGHVNQLGTNDIDHTFDGNVNATIFDCIKEITCKYNEKDKIPVPPMVYNERSKSIFKGSTKAKDGKFEFVVCIPKDISYSNRSGRISFYAVNTDRTTEYNGNSEIFCLNGTADSEEPDTKGPEVVAFINSIDNPDFTITDANPVLIANIKDEYGINNAGISLGHDIELVLDGNAADPINLNSHFTYDFGSYQSGQLVYEMKGLDYGQHTAQLRVWDVNNNATITDVHFIVRSKNAEGGKDGYVTSTKNPATTDTRFVTYFPADDTVEGIVYFEVYDTRGRCVFKQPVAVTPGNSSASTTWDLCSNDHQPLPAGIYFYRTVFNTSKGTKSTDAQKLIIVRQ